MHDHGYAVYLIDSVTGQPVAIFAYRDDAVIWAEWRYSRWYRIETIDWQQYTSKHRTMAIGGPTP